MKKNTLKRLGAMVLGFVLMGTTVFAATDFGAAGVEQKQEFTLEEMLEYAIQDEYLAREEYAQLIETFEVSRPFSNIIKAEERHIELIEGLYETHELEIPEVDASSYVVIPETLEEAFETGVQAEINNIAMYDKFLETELPEDVRAVFEQLKKGSEYHLAAFERNVEGTNGNQGNGVGVGNGNGRGNGVGGGRGNKNNSSTSKGNQGSNRNLETCIFN